MADTPVEKPRSLFGFGPDDVTPYWLRGTRAAFPDRDPQEPRPNNGEQIEEPAMVEPVTSVPAGGVGNFIYNTMVSTLGAKTTFGIADMFGRVQERYEEGQRSIMSQIEPNADPFGGLRGSNTREDIPPEDWKAWQEGRIGDINDPSTLRSLMAKTKAEMNLQNIRQNTTVTDPPLISGRLEDQWTIGDSYRYMFEVGNEWGTPKGGVLFASLFGEYATDEKIKDAIASFDPETREYFQDLYDRGYLSASGGLNFGAAATMLAMEETGYLPEGTTEEFTRRTNPTGRIVGRNVVHGYAMMKLAMPLLVGVADDVAHGAAAYISRVSGAGKIGPAIDKLFGSEGYTADEWDKEQQAAIDHAKQSLWGLVGPITETVNMVKLASAGPEGMDQLMDMIDEHPEVLSTPFWAVMIGRDIYTKIAPSRPAPGPRTGGRIREPQPLAIEDVPTGGRPASFVGPTRPRGEVGREGIGAVDFEPRRGTGDIYADVWGELDRAMTTMETEAAPQERYQGLVPARDFHENVTDVDIINARSRMSRRRRDETTAANLSEGLRGHNIRDLIRYLLDRDPMDPTIWEKSTVAERVGASIAGVWGRKTLHDLSNSQLLHILSNLEGLGPEAPAKFMGLRDYVQAVLQDRSGAGQEVILGREPMAEALATRRTHQEQRMENLMDAKRQRREQRPMTPEEELAQRQAQARQGRSPEEIDADIERQKASREAPPEDLEARTFEESLAAQEGLERTQFPERAATPRPITETIRRRRQQAADIEAGIPVEDLTFRPGGRLGRPLAPARRTGVITPEQRATARRYRAEADNLHDLRKRIQYLTNEYNGLSEGDVRRGQIRTQIRELRNELRAAREAGGLSTREINEQLLQITGQERFNGESVRQLFRATQWTDAYLRFVEEQLGVDPNTITGEMLADAGDAYALTRELQNRGINTNNVVVDVQGDRFARRTIHPRELAPQVADMVEATDILWEGASDRIARFMTVEAPPEGGVQTRVSPGIKAARDVGELPQEQVVTAIQAFRDARKAARVEAVNAGKLDAQIRELQDAGDPVPADLITRHDNALKKARAAEEAAKKAERHFRRLRDLRRKTRPIKEKRPTTTEVRTEGEPTTREVLTRDVVFEEVPVEPGVLETARVRMETELANTEDLLSIMDAGEYHLLPTKGLRKMALERPTDREAFYDSLVAKRDALASQLAVKPRIDGPIDLDLQRYQRITQSIERIHQALERGTRELENRLNADADIKALLEKNAELTELLAESSTILEERPVPRDHIIKHYPSILSRGEHGLLSNLPGKGIRLPPKKGRAKLSQNAIASNLGKKGVFASPDAPDRRVGSFVKSAELGLPDDLIHLVATVEEGGVRIYSLDLNTEQGVFRVVGNTKFEGVTGLEFTPTTAELVKGKPRNGLSPQILKNVEAKFASALEKVDTTRPVGDATVPVENLQQLPLKVGDRIVYRHGANKRAAGDVLDITPDGEPIVTRSRVRNTLDAEGRREALRKIDDNLETIRQARDIIRDTADEQMIAVPHPTMPGRSITKNRGAWRRDVDQLMRDRAILQRRFGQFTRRFRDPDAGKPERTTKTVPRVRVIRRTVPNRRLTPAEAAAEKASGNIANRRFGEMQSALDELAATTRDLPDTLADIALQPLFRALSENEAHLRTVQDLRQRLFAFADKNAEFYPETKTTETLREAGRVIVPVGEGAYVTAEQARYNRAQIETIAKNLTKIEERLAQYGVKNLREFADQFEYVRKRRREVYLRNALGEKLEKPLAEAENYGELVESASRLAREILNNNDLIPLQSLEALKRFTEYFDSPARADIPVQTLYTLTEALGRHVDNIVGGKPTNTMRQRLSVLEEMASLLEAGFREKQRIGRRKEEVAFLDELKDVLEDPEFRSRVEARGEFANIPLSKAPSEAAATEAANILRQVRLREARRLKGKTQAAARRARVAEERVMDKVTELAAKDIERGERALFEMETATKALAENELRAARLRDLAKAREVRSEKAAARRRKKAADARRESFMEVLEEQIRRTRNEIRRTRSEALKAMKQKTLDTLRQRMKALKEACAKGAP